MNAPPPVRQLIVLAHPDPGSFCAKVARCWEQRSSTHGQVCSIRDLYAEGFDPVLKAHEQPGKPGYAPAPEALAECRSLQELDVLVFVYPVWFGTPPAMMKGYIERVLGSGTSFGKSGELRKPLKNARLVQISTSAATRPVLAEEGIEAALHTVFDRYVADIFGAAKAEHLHLDSIGEGMSAAEAAIKLEEVRELADKVCADANAARWQEANLGGHSTGNEE